MRCVISNSPWHYQPSIFRTWIGDCFMDMDIANNKVVFGLSINSNGTIRKFTPREWFNFRAMADQIYAQIMGWA